MRPGALVIRKLRWGLLSKSLGIIIAIDDDDFAAVLWSDAQCVQKHYLQSLEEVLEDDKNYRQRTCISI